jgi:hypothetical protein
MKLRRIVVDKAALGDWIKEHAKDVPSDLEVFAVRESVEYEDHIEVVVKSDSFTYVPDGSAPVVWRAVVKRCAGCLST